MRFFRTLWKKMENLERYQSRSEETRNGDAAWQSGAPRRPRSLAQLLPVGRQSDSRSASPDLIRSTNEKDHRANVPKDDRCAGALLAFQRTSVAGGHSSRFECSPPRVFVTSSRTGIVLHTWQFGAFRLKVMYGIRLEIDAMNRLLELMYFWTFVVNGGRLSILICNVRVPSR